MWLCGMSCGFPCEMRSEEQEQTTGKLEEAFHVLEEYGKFLAVWLQICVYLMDTFWEKKIVRSQREIREWRALWDNVNEKQNTSVKIMYLVMFMG